MAVDPATVEIVRNQLLKIGEEMQAQVMNAAYSSIWQEAGDLSCAILSEGAEIVGQSQRAIPIHIGTMMSSVGGAIEKTGGFDALCPGDVLIQNDPYSGNNHLPDFVIAQPIFAEDTLLGFSAVRGHWLDVGGSSPSSYAMDTGEIVKEGLRVPPAKLYRAGVENVDLVETILSNVRDRRERTGDFNAQLSGVRHGHDRVLEVAAKYGPETFLAACDTVLSNEERRVRNAIERLPDGTSRAEDHLDGDSVSDELITIVATVEVDGSSIHVDFAGSDGQVFGGVNAPIAVTRAATFAAIKMTLDPGDPGTSGSYRPIEVSAPLGSIVNPEYPAPVVAGNHETANRVFDVVVRAIAEIEPSLAFGAGEGSTNGFTYQSTVSRRINRTRMSGGIGACPHRDGVNGKRSGIGNAGYEPVESVEARYEFVRVEELSIVPDTGGAGRFRGGNAGRMVTRLADPSEIIITSERGKTRPYGIDGGRPGSLALHVRVTPDGEEVELPSKLSTEIEGGSSILLQPAGGGGYGDPGDRPPEEVLADVIDGYVSVESAREEYGVVVDPESLTIDEEATAELRTDGDD